MRKGFFVGLLLLSFLSFGQHFCGFEEVQKELDEKYPNNKKKRELLDDKLRRKGVYGVLSEYGIDTQLNIEEIEEMSTASSSYKGRIYEIPVVVHVIESKNLGDLGTNVTDEQIINWIENTNKMYATTYGNGFFEEGSGPNGGTVIPFKLVLAKRTPECKPTNGIIRYDGARVANYAGVGMARGANGTGAKVEDIKALAPHWPETVYYNIYLVIGFNGDKGDYGLLGWATLPDSNWLDYETFMKTSVVKKANDDTLAHEFGHALGLFHPFNGGSETDCPSNNNCNEDNDLVCDTEPTKSLLGVLTPSNSDINTCTNRNYEGVQYNIMNYTFEPRKFTPGQRNRALAMFLSQRGALVNSSGAIPPPTDIKSINIKPSSCKPTNIKDRNPDYNIGVKRVKIGNIDNHSTPFDKIYVDYTSLSTCIYTAYTDIPDNKKSSITVEGGHLNNQWITIWIDYNNNGIFEAKERLGKKRVLKTDSKYTLEFTPPSTAVKNTYLRMRVRGDYIDSGACDILDSGQIEDYAVRIVTDDFVDEEEKGIKGGVGINTEKPRVSLDIRKIPIDRLPKGTPQGVIFPSFKTQERATFRNIKEGTMIYNKDLKCIEIYVDNTWKCM